MQMRALREYAARRGWITAVQVKEIGSGAIERELREKLLDAARRREIDVALVWHLDRWGRSVADLLATLEELALLGVGFVPLTEALDLTTPAGRAMAGLLAIFAEFEREILRERVRASLAHARQNGKRLGGPITAARKAAEVRKLFRNGLSKSKIARRLQIGRTSVRRILAWAVCRDKIVIDVAARTCPTDLHCHRPNAHDTPDLSPLQERVSRPVPTWKCPGLSVSFDACLLKG